VVPSRVTWCGLCWIWYLDQPIRCRTELALDLCPRAQASVVSTCSRNFGASDGLIRFAPRLTWLGLVSCQSRNIRSWDPARRGRSPRGSGRGGTAGVADRVGRGEPSKVPLPPGDSPLDLAADVCLRQVWFGPGFGGLRTQARRSRMLSEPRRKHNSPDMRRSTTIRNPGRTPARFAP